MALLTLAPFIILVGAGLFLLNLNMAAALFLFLSWTALYLLQTRRAGHEEHRKGQSAYVLGLLVLFLACISERHAG